MKKITTFLLALLLTIPAMAVDLTGGEVLYLKTNGSTNWAADNARFCMYLCNGTSSAEWVDMTLVETGIYQGVVPSGKNHKNVIFVRMNPSSSSNSWSNKWNQTADLTYDGTKNLFTPSGWDNASTTWSTYTPVAEELVIPDGLFSYNEGEYAVFFVNDGGFSTPTVHVWGGYSTSWPGTKMTKIDGQVNNKYDCYKWVITTTDDVPTGLIISDNGGTKAGGGNLVYVNGGVYDGNGELLTTIAAVEPTITLSYSPETIYVDDEVTLSSTVLNGGDDYTVKYYVDGVENSETWTPTAVGDYTLTANLIVGGYIKTSDEKTVTVKEHTTLTFTVEVPAGTENCYIIGSFAQSNWNIPIEMNKVTDIKYTVDLLDVDKETVKYKYATNAVVGNLWTNEEVTAEDGAVGDRNYSESDVVAKWKGIDLEEAQTTLYLRGTMNDWLTTNVMTYDEVNGTYSCEVALTANEQFKIADENWNTVYGYSYFGESKNNYPIKVAANDDNIEYIGADATVTITVDITNKTITLEGAKFVENIVCEKNYYLDTNNIWNTDDAWFAAYFFNKNTNASTWVKGELVNGYYLFYLSQYNVPAAAPARAKAEVSEAPVYTHVIFTRMNPEFSVLDWDKTEVVDNGDGTTTTNVIEDRVWNQTADLTYNGTVDNALATFQITSAEGEGTWINLPTGIEAVEAADGIVYAGNVVVAEGAIEVYNMSGAVVAYGEDALDLRGLNAGIYVVRNGNNVLKVVR